MIRESIKSYHLFLPQIWKKLLLYFVYPLFLIGITCLFAQTGADASVYLVSMCATIMTAELYFDILVFGGIASKDTDKLEYLKTSVKGMSVLKKSIVADGIRRFLSTAVILIAAYAIADMYFSPAELAMCLLATLFMTEAGLLVIRGFASISIMVATAVVGGMVFTVLLIAVWRSAALILVSSLLVVLYVTVLILGRVFVMKKARGSYYDERL